MRIGIDVGGTKIMGGLIREDGTTAEVFRLASRSFGSLDAMALGIAQALQGALSAQGLSLGEITHFGVGIPGTADWQRGRVVYSPNLFGEDVPLADVLERAVGRRPLIVQDSWAGAYAEYRFGQQQRYADMMCVTLGTGIGCGIIQSGRVYGGMMGTAGEIGHVSIHPQGRPCSCGRRGCLETYASGTGIYAQALERFPEKLVNLPQGAQAVFTLIRQGDKEAAALLEECMEHLAFGLAALINITGCPRIFISGGMSGQSDLILPLLQKTIPRYGYPAWSSRYSPMVEKASLGDEAPMVGAAFLTAQSIL